MSDAMLEALQRCRQQYLNLSSLPSLNGKTLLIPYLKNLNKPLTNDDQIREAVQNYFDQAADQLEAEENKEETNELRIVTVHWLRHTGIVVGVKNIGFAS